MVTSEATALIADIENAFRHGVKPSVENISPLQHQVGHGEAEDLVECLGGRDWRSVSDDEIYDIGMWASLLTPEAFHYYLPSLLCCCVRRGPGAGAVWEFLPCWMAPSPQRKVLLNEMFLRQAQMLDLGQARVMVAFYKYVITVEFRDPDRVIWPWTHLTDGLKYWSERVQSLGTRTV